MILSTIAERLKRQSKNDFKGRHFQASLILQAVSWYLRYPLSYRDIEELFLERGLAVDHALHLKLDARATLFADQSGLYCEFAILNTSLGRSIWTGLRDSHLS